MDKCPGQDKRSVKAGLIPCPACGYQVEIFSDEMRRKCPECRHEVCREALPDCAHWCKAAKECIGKEKWEQLQKREG